MIIWSGAGLLVPILAVLGIAVSAIVSSGLFGDERGGSRWIGFAGLLLGALFVPLRPSSSLFVPRLQRLQRFSTRKPPRVLVDEETGERVELGGDHSLFFLPVKYWPFLMVAFAIALPFLGGGEQ